MCGLLKQKLYVFVDTDADADAGDEKEGDKDKKDKDGAAGLDSFPMVLTVAGLAAFSAGQLFHQR